MFPMMMNFLLLLSLLLSTFTKTQAFCTTSRNCRRFGTARNVLEKADESSFFVPRRPATVPPQLTQLWRDKRSLLESTNIFLPTQNLVRVLEREESRAFEESAESFMATQHNDDAASTTVSTTFLTPSPPQSSTNSLASALQNFWKPVQSWFSTSDNNNSKPLVSHEILPHIPLSQIQGAALAGVAAVAAIAGPENLTPVTITAAAAVPAYASLTRSRLGNVARVVGTLAASALQCVHKTASVILSEVRSVSPHTRHEFWGMIRSRARRWVRSLRTAWNHRQSQRAQQSRDRAAHQLFAARMQVQQHEYLERRAIQRSNQAARALFEARMALQRKERQQADAQRTTLLLHKQRVPSKHERLAREWQKANGRVHRPTDSDDESLPQLLLNYEHERRQVQQLREQIQERALQSRRRATFVQGAERIKNFRESKAGIVHMVSRFNVVERLSIHLIAASANLQVAR